MGGFRMAISIPRGGSDPVIDKFVEALREFQADYPDAQIDLYRQNPVSVRLRIIDRSFKGLSEDERQKRMWRYLDRVDEESFSDLSLLILLTPDEVESSFANVEFDDPVPAWPAVEPIDRTAQPTGE